mmetsp:Transcript_46575/g.148647  ORF Transcript_46575/g.148647 Transcript_46575/m.148647 type:complete len:250 (+) Transcript_46575:856-1605(+)
MVILSSTDERRRPALASALWPPAAEALKSCSRTSTRRLTFVLGEHSTDDREIPEPSSALISSQTVFSKFRSEIGFQWSFLPSGSSAAPPATPAFALERKPPFAFGGPPFAFGGGRPLPPALPGGPLPAPFPSAAPSAANAVASASSAVARGPAPPPFGGGGGPLTLPFPLPFAGAGAAAASASPPAAACSRASSFGGSPSGSSLATPATPARAAPELLGGGGAGPFPLPVALPALDATDAVASAFGDKI